MNQFSKSGNSGNFRGKGKTPGKRPFVAKGRRKKRKVPHQVVELAQKHNLSIAVAFKVYKEHMSLEQALKENEEKEKRKEKAQKICDNYPKIGFALACLLVKDNMTPEEYMQGKIERKEKEKEKDRLKRERMGSDDKQTVAYQKLLEYSQNKTELILYQYGGKYSQGKINDFTPYEFFFTEKEEQISKIHRLKLKYFCEQKTAKSIQKMIFVDKGTSKKKLRPSYGPEGRYQFSERMLREGNEIMLALHEGEMIRGTIAWYTPYDIFLMAGKNPLWVFRHAVMECSLTKRAKK